MSIEQRMILEMLSEGKINVSQAENLLSLSDKETTEFTTAKSINRKFLKIIVIEENNTKVNINIPLALAEVGLKFIPKDMLQIEGNVINIPEILKLIREGGEGELVNIETFEKGKEVKVNIFIH